MEDPRKTALKNGLRQLTSEQIVKVLQWPHEMVLDSWNYKDGMFCPLAVAVGLPETMTSPSHDSVRAELEKLGFRVNNTQGIKGEFYTSNRKADLFEAASEVIQERIR